MSDEQAVTLRTIIKKEFEIMPNNTYIHPDEKKILRWHVEEFAKIFDDSDVDCHENNMCRKAIEVLNRISL